MNEEYEERLSAHNTTKGTVWRWQRGDYYSQDFFSEEEAHEAADDGQLEFNRPDGGDAVSDLYERKAEENGNSGPYDYWLIGGAFVTEPTLGGMQLGELPEYQMPKGASVLEMTQAEFDVLMNDFYMQYGYYPDT